MTSPPTQRNQREAIRELIFSDVSGDGPLKKRELATVLYALTGEKPSVTKKELRRRIADAAGTAQNDYSHEFRKGALIAIRLALQRASNDHEEGPPASGPR